MAARFLFHIAGGLKDDFCLNTKMLLQVDLKPFLTIISEDDFSFLQGGMDRSFRKINQSEMVTLYNSRIKTSALRKSLKNLHQSVSKYT